VPENVFRDFLKKNEALFNAVVSQSGQGISVCSTDGRYLFVNDAFCSMTGYNPEDFNKMTVREFIPPETELNLFSKVVNQQTGAREVELVKKNGERFWVETRGYPIKIDGISYVIGTILDITKRKAVERQLRENEEKFRAAFHTSPDAINLNRLDDGVFVEINRGFTEIMGYCPADIIGKSSLDFGVWRKYEDRNAIVMQLQERGAVDDFEAEFVTKSGDVRIGLMSARIVKIAGEKLILSNTRDITRKRQSEENYRLLTEHSTDMISKHDPNGVFLYVSPACKQIVGYSPDELTGRDVYDFFHPEDLENIIESHSTIEKTPSTYTVAYRFNHKKGHYVWVEATSKTIRDSNSGDVKEIVATTRDITKRKQVETERENLLKELQEALENVKTLSGMLPICASCKKIRDDKGYWQQIESYLYHHTDAQLSHGLCPDCAQKLYPEYADDEDISG
jgi:PAS domain S-box-containing protein